MSSVSHLANELYFEHRAKVLEAERISKEKRDEESGKNTVKIPNPLIPGQFHIRKHLGNGCIRYLD